MNIMPSESRRVRQASCPANIETMTPPRTRPRRIKQSSLGIPTDKEEFFQVQERYRTDDDDENDPWQVRLLEFLNSKLVTHFLIGLLMLDVTILFIELGMDAFFPSCYTIERDGISCCPTEGDGSTQHLRLLATDDQDHSLCEAPLIETKYPIGCDSHKYHGVHVAHNVLFTFTIIILVTFELELLTMIYLIGPKRFFAKFFYVVDLFIVTISLVLEVLFRSLHSQIASDLAGALIFFRVWRFVRIGHGFIASTYEMQEEKFEKWMEYVEELEILVKKSGQELPDNKPHTDSDSEEHEEEEEKRLNEVIE